MALLALIAGQDVEPAEGSDGTDGRWRIALKVTEDRVVSTVDPDSRHVHKSRHRQQDGYKAHVAAEPGTGLFTGGRLLLALAGNALAGWVHLRRQPDQIVAHWGTISHLQTLPAFRGQGIGGALMTHARHVAREEMGLEQLHLAVRGGTGLERFYSGLGWEVTGRWPGALRFAPGDDRDEILMILAPL